MHEVFFIFQILKLINFLLDDFLRYVKIDTQSDEESTTSPSTMKQYDLLNLLKEVQEEQDTIDKEMKNVKKEVMAQLDEQKNNFEDSLSNFEKNTNDNVDKVIQLMREKILKKKKESN